MDMVRTDDKKASCRQLPTRAFSYRINHAHTSQKTGNVKDTCITRMSITRARARASSGDIAVSPPLAFAPFVPGTTC